VRLSNISDDDITEIFGDVTFCSSDDISFKAFVTEEINESEFSAMKEKATSVNADILSVIRVIY